MLARTRAVTASVSFPRSRSFTAMNNSAAMLTSRLCRHPIRPQLDLNVLIEEELLSSYHSQDYYTVRIGTVLDKRYKVLAKLGFGRYSTAWLGKDTRRWRWHSPRFVTIKVQTLAMSERSEDNMELRLLELFRARHDKLPGVNFLRFPRASFGAIGPGGRHTCLIYEPMHQTLRALLRETTLPVAALKVLLQRLLEGLDYLHTECNVIHTDIHNDNILLEIKVPRMLKVIEQHERNDPSPVKVYSTHQVHSSLSVSADPGPPQLADFGNSIFGPGPFTHVIQPDRLRAPEVILGIGWSYSADIWNLGVSLWDILERRVLFSGVDPETGEYSAAVHLQEMLMLLGRPPRELLAWSRSTKFFTPEGDVKNSKSYPGENYPDLESTITQLEGVEKQKFLRFVGRMLTWLPGQRATARNC